MEAARPLAQALPYSRSLEGTSYRPGLDPGGSVPFSPIDIARAAPRPAFHSGPAETSCRFRGSPQDKIHRRTRDSPRAEHIEQGWDRRPCKSPETQSRRPSHSLQGTYRRSSGCFSARSALQLARAWPTTPLAARQIRSIGESWLFVGSTSLSSSPPCKLF